MGEILEEVRIWNTPLIDAYLLWRFTLGYSSKRKNGEAPVALNHFIAMAILSSQRLLSSISNRRADLQSYVRSFEESKDSDILLTIHERTKEKLSYTMKAIDIAVSQGLLFWDIETAQLYAKTSIQKPSRGNALKSVHVKNGDKAEILGRWFANHEIDNIAKYLKIVL